MGKIKGELNMAVDMTDIQSLLKNVDLKSILGDTGMADTTGGLGIGGGVLGAVLVGALLPRLLGDPNAAAAVAATKTLDAADVQAIVTGAQNSQTLGNVEGEIWKAEGQLQAALQAATNTQQITTLNAEIATLQGQSGILAAIANNGKDIVNEVHETGDVVNSSVQTLSAANAAGFGVVNTNIAQNAYATAQVVTNDGEKTRAAIALLSASIPNARELDLQRQLTVALDDHRHSNTRAAIDSGNTIVTTNVNQTAAAQANATVQQQIVGLLGQVASAIQQNTQSTVNLGTMIGSGQTATNVRA
jgi:hypothetical protein